MCVSIGLHDAFCMNMQYTLQCISICGAVLALVSKQLDCFLRHTKSPEQRHRKRENGREKERAREREKQGQIHKVHSL